MGDWKNCVWLDGNVGKINIGTHLEGWWSDGKKIDFGFWDLDGGVDMDCGSQGTKMDGVGDGTYKVVYFGT